MKALAIAGSNLRRTLRDRSNIFFIFLFPMLMIFVLGAAFGGSAQPRLGVAVERPGPLADRLVGALAAAEGVDVERADAAEVVAAVERGELEVGVVVPAGYDEAVAAGRPIEVSYVARPGLTGQQVGAIVRSVVGRESGRLRAASFAAGERGLPFAEALARADAAAYRVPAIEVTGRMVGEGVAAAAREGRFDGSAYTQLLLFLFVTALTSAVALVETRVSGVSRRMLTTPTSTVSIIIGEGLGRFAISACQGLAIMVFSALMFGVSWGDPLAAGLLMVCFALVAGGAGMLLGAVARTTQVATAVGLLLGLGLAALGGTMMPLEFFSPAMRTAAHVVTPHAWAVDGFTELIRDGGGVGDIMPEMSVLVAAAAALTGAASWRLRRSVVP